MVDANYEYISGSILRHVTVDKASGGIVCNSATPYLSHITLTGGGLNCTPGTLTVDTQALPSTMLVADSGIRGALTVNSAALIWRNTVTGGGISVSGQASVLTNTVSGGINVGGGSTVQSNTAGGSISLSGSGLVLNNTLSGGLSVGSATTVLSNTIRGGGITVGDQSLVRGNNVENASGWGVTANGNATIIANRLVGNANGVNVSSGLVQGNLIANNSGVGLQIGPATVISNTLTANSGSAIVIASGAPAKISGNNLEGNKGQYDIENRVPKSSLMTVPAQRNWWGITSGSAIGKRIYDFNDDYTLGTVLYSPVLTQTVADAPAYIRAITLTPESPVGIQTVTFEVLFSRPMETEGNPVVEFHTTRKGAWQTYNTTNSGLASNWVDTIAEDAAANKWFGTDGGASVLRVDGTWQTYNTSNSGLASNYVNAIAVDTTENKWFGTNGGTSVLHVDGTWQRYNIGNVKAIAVDTAGNKWFGTDRGASVLRVDGTWQTYTISHSVVAIAVDTAGNKWFGTDSGVSVLRVDGTWYTYNTSNSGLADDNVWALVTDTEDSKWVGTEYGGISVLHANGMWQTYNPSNSGLASNMVYAVAADAAGNKWFGTARGASVLHVDGTWQTYNISNNFIRAIAVDAAGNKWFGTGWYYATDGEGVSMLGDGTDYIIINSPQWPTPNLYRAIYDFSTLIPRDVYSLIVSGAQGTDGIEIASYSGITFTVDYAGYISDQTQPPPPTVGAQSNGTTSTISARWSAHDPESSITLYQYAIGSTPGGAEVVNWTTIGVTEVVRSGLSLAKGQTYYVSVKARNEGGLWSEAGISNGVVAGQETRYSQVYLPLLFRLP